MKKNTQNKTNKNSLEAVSKNDNIMQKINSNTTEACNDIAYHMKDSGLAIWDMEGVNAAKDWIDNGNQL
ncbi:MAG: CDIF630_02480 family spore surface protein [Cellulosilyticaceae bacterium]